MSFADFENMPQMTESEKESVRHLFPTYFFYRNITRSRREAVCSSCGAKLYAHKTIDGRILGYEDLWSAIRDKEDECPNCGAEGVYKPANVYRDMASLHCYQNVVWFFPSEDGQTVYAGAYSVISIYSPDDQAKLEFVEKAKYLFRPGYSSCVWRSVTLYDRSYHYIGKYLDIYRNGFCGRVEPWQECVRVREPWQNMFWNTCAGYFLPNLDVLQNSFFRYSCYGLFLKMAPARGYGCQGSHKKLMVFLREYCKRPAMEIALRCRGQSAVKDLVYFDLVGHKKFNWQAKTPQEFYGVTKAIWNELRKGSFDISNFIIEIAGIDIPFTVENLKSYMDLRENKGLSSDQSFVVLWLSKVLLQSPQKILNYLHRQNRTIYFYRDYIQAGHAFGMDFTKGYNVFPVDLLGAHDDAMGIKRKKDYADLEALYEKTLATREKMYSYSEDRYFIRLPESAEEIVSEGDSLGICVGFSCMGYIQRHLKGQKTILFMRSVLDPDTPLYCIEMDGMTLKQIEGYKHCALQLDEQKAFFNRWLQFVKTGKKPEIPVESSEENQVKVG